MYDRGTGRVNAAAAVLALANIMDDVLDKKLVVSSSQLLQSLPMDATLDDVSEMILITWYILPAIQPLFDDDDKSTRLEFTCSDPANIYERPLSFNGCPDLTITVHPHQINGGVNVGYHEVKRFSMARNHLLVNWGLVRLALFGKSAMNKHNFASNMSVHVVGKFVLKKNRSYAECIFLLAPYMTFYAIQLQAVGLYMMTELARVQFPMSILELPAYFTNFMRLKKS